MDGTRSRSSPGLVLLTFLRLGCTSFGGPIAHLGYFRSEFVLRRKWLDESAYADIIGLCQFLPGPTSSQVGFTIGLLEAGPLGGLAAWTGFTLPSALLMFAFAYGHMLFSGRLGLGVLHGLQLVAVAVVAQAAFGMMRTLAPDRTSTVHKPSDFTIVLAGYLALTVWEAPPWAVVCAIAAIGAASTLLT
jgi:chromate transporter